MNYHPAAELFPLMQGADFAELVADMAEHGQREPVVTYDGLILDGRNRWRACQELGLVPVCREWDGVGDPESFVVSLNLHRRHLDSEQRREVMRQLRARGMTLQKIADVVGVSYGTAHSATKDVELINFDKLPGADGKHYPAHYTPREVAPEPQEADDADDAPDDYEFNRQQILEANRQGAMIEVPPASMPHVAHNSGNNEWYTPAEYIAAARAVMGAIDLDPASTAIANAVVQAAHFYTAEDDGLAQPWAGCVWLNPPYASELIGQFIDKLVTSDAVTEAVVLVNNATETRWFQALAGRAAAVCFPASRVRFWNPNKESATPLQGQAVVYIGATPGLFCEVFQRFGWTARR